MGEYELESPVDAVITWVDGEEQKHKEKINRYASNTIKKNNGFSLCVGYHLGATGGLTLRLFCFVQQKNASIYN